MNAKMKAAEMKEWAAYLFKLAVLRDLFEINEIGDRLRSRTNFSYGNPTLGQYFRGKRKPEPYFFDYVRQGLELDDRSYQSLLYLYHQSLNSPTQHQKRQMNHFEDMLFERLAEQFRGEGEAVARSSDS